MDIVKYPHDALRMEAAELHDIDERVIQVAEEMVDAMHAAEGIGLAAPQVDLPWRLFVVHVKNDKPRIFINPEIVQTSLETTAYEEGCLSIPGVYADVERAAQVQVQAFNERGRPFSLAADGMLARVVLHEYDHLKGVLFFDHLRPRRREKLLKEYDQLVHAS
ncbi:MAG: peptide deformylase [Spirochaetota bacterium]